MKCKRISSINITNFSSGNNNIDEFIYDNHYNIYDCINKVEKSSCPLNLYKYIKNQAVCEKSIMKWFPHSQFTNLKKIADGGFGMIYKATRLDGENTTVAIKRFLNSQDISKYFLNEVNYIKINIIYTFFIYFKI